jgi:hypothetical protein
MTEPSDPAGAAEALLRAQGRVPPASVTPLVSVVRSGEQFLIIPPSDGEPSASALGRILLEWGYEVPRAQYGTFQAFLRDNNGLLATSPVAGLTYHGTYTVFQQSERSLGSFRTIWGLESLKLLEDMSAQVADPKNKWGEAVKALMGFRDPDYTAGRSQVILQLAAATLIETAKPPG